MEGVSAQHSDRVYLRQASGSRRRSVMHSAPPGLCRIAAHSLSTSSPFLHAVVLELRPNDQRDKEVGLELNAPSEMEGSSHNDLVAWTASRQRYKAAVDL